jgi:uncharacterized protein
MTNPTANQIIDRLNLQPLPVEGGLFRQTYVSAELVPGAALPGRYAGQEKPFCTAIYYLLTAGSFSALHRLRTDETYHFYLGDPLELTLLYPTGEAQQVMLGQDIMDGQHLQFTVPAYTWQGSRVAPGGEYALVGTTVSPGYANEDFEAGNRQLLTGQYPMEAQRIYDLTRSDI